MINEKKIVISRKIALVFGTLTFVFFSTAILCLYILNKNSEYSRQEYTIGISSENALTDFSHLLEKNELLITLWVYNNEEIPEKENLIELIENDYVEQKNALNNLSVKWNNTTLLENENTLQSELTQTLKAADSLLNLQKLKVVNQLSVIDAYDNNKTMNEITFFLNNQIIPLSNNIISRINNLSKAFVEIHQFKSSLDNNRTFLKIVIVISKVLFLGLSIMCALLLIRWLKQSISRMNLLLDSIEKQNDLSKLSNDFTNDEFGMVEEKLKDLAGNIKKITEFAHKIGQQQFDTDFFPTSQYDVLGHSLVKMRDSLKVYKEESDHRHWETNSLAVIDQILRNHHNSLEELAYSVLADMVDNLNANQGSFFVVENNNKEEILSLKAGFAWGRRKYLNDEIGYGEGLTGQAWKDKQTIYVNDLPDDYISITSGLGEANPSSLIIVPLLFNEKVLGVVELASFHVFTEQQTTFLEKATRNIAAFISYLKQKEDTSNK